jgi:hypothetical protein
MLGMLLLGVILVGGVASCGGGGAKNISGTTAGTYTVTVTGSSGTTTAQTTVKIEVE